MQAKLHYIYSADGDFIKVNEDSPNAHVYQGQVAATTYYLTVTSDDASNQWLSSDRVYIAFRRPDGATAERRMDYQGDNIWSVVSDGWETDVDIADNVDSVPLRVSFVARRYSTTGNPVLITTRTTGYYTETIYKSGTFYPQEIQEPTVVEYVEGKLDEHSERLDAIDGQIVDLDERITIAEGAATVDTVTGEADDLVDNTDPKNPIIMHDITKANLVVGATVDNLAKLTSSGDLADSGKSIADLALKTDITDNLTSTATDKPLSANQGNALKALIDNKEDSLGFTPENSVNKNTAYGYCPLDSVAKVPLANLPTIPTKDSNLTNDRYVRYDSDGQGLTDTQKANARSNIGAGDSGFSGNYNDLANKPDLKPHATTAPSTTQSNSTTTVPSDKLLKESSFARIYREATELSGVTYPISIANLLTAIIAANPLNSMFIIGVNSETETKVTGLPATFGALTIIVPGETALRMRVEFSKELGSNTTQQYIGNITRSGSTVSSVAWDMVITDNGTQTLGGAKTFTENITLSKASPYIFIKNSTDEYNVTPSSNHFSGIEITDKNGVYTGGFRGFRNTDGSTYTHIVARNQSNAAVSTGLRGYADGTWTFLPSMNNLVDIGTNAARYKDLYLSGNINMAGTFTDNVTVSNAIPKILIKSTTDVYNVTAPFLATGLECTDKNGVYTGAFRTFRSSDGSTSVNMTARNQANALMTVGLRGFTNGTWALVGDTPGVVDIGSTTSRFKDLYLAGNINAAGTIKGNVESSPYKLIASGTLAASASLNIISQIVAGRGRPFYMRIWGGTTADSGAKAHFLFGTAFGKNYTRTQPIMQETTYTTSRVAFIGGQSADGTGVGEDNNGGDLITLQYSTQYTSDSKYRRVFCASQEYLIAASTDGVELLKSMQIIKEETATVSPLYIVNDNANYALNYQLYSANY